MIQVLIDADNLSAPQLRALVAALPAGGMRIVVAGSPRALASVAWPPRATVIAVEGWQQADLRLAAAYRLNDEPLVLGSGDGDFSLLVVNHPGPVLVISDRPASRLRGAGTVTDPVTDGTAVLRRWLDEVAG
ncbi:hypothetical protein BH20ACT7_BH20ACT7_06620 [soil metagenome]